MSAQPSRIRQLISDARDGDAAARDELFQCCRNYVAVVARTQVESWMRTKVDASDLVQQTLLDAHQGFEQFQGTEEGEWLAWLKQILAHNTQDFIRRYRTAKRAVGKEVSGDRQTESRAGILENLRESIDSPSQALMAHERELELADAISRLSPDHQEVIHLRSLQRLSFNEVAERMGRSRPATQMLWFRAVEKLEEILKENSPE
ncbi:MAG: sigma-70 family RNA polymerase sigma factor [Planctomycetaceae bacterium]|nr:sigma-70 family RNA polymerase sigma factor [Planctomycetaceae bacterium]